MREKLFFILLLLVPFLAKADTDECRHLSGGHESIDLLSTPKSPAFYVRSEPYFIFFNPDDVLSYLSHQTQGSIKQFTKSLSSDVPLQRNLDLYFYALSNGSLAREIDILVADLLGHGKATILHVGGIWPGSGKPLDSINIYKTENSSSGWRFFCTKEKETIYVHLDYKS